MLEPIPISQSFSIFGLYSHRPQSGPTPTSYITPFNFRLRHCFPAAHGPFNLWMQP
jgi:hypothetical protein